MRKFLLKLRVRLQLGKAVRALTGGDLDEKKAGINEIRKWLIKEMEK